VLKAHQFLFKKFQVTLFRSRSTNGEIHADLRAASLLYGCETWSLIFREKHHLTVFENRMMSENNQAYEGGGKRAVEKTT
jgi:hypothetical protein